jgi:hypothetical protein
MTTRKAPEGPFESRRPFSIRPSFPLSSPSYLSRLMRIYSWPLCHYDLPHDPPYPPDLHPCSRVRAALRTAESPGVFRILFLSPSPPVYRPAQVAIPPTCPILSSKVTSTTVTLRHVPVGDVLEALSSSLTHTTCSYP